MTLTMQDSITPANLTPGADAYLGYVDGSWPTYSAVKQRFGNSAHVLSLAVFPASDAEGCDCENGDLLTAQVPAWAARQVLRGVHRPVVYASVSAMPLIAATLDAAGLARPAVRLLSAHYGIGSHICGPGTCRWPGVPAMDGTQWTDHAPGASGSLIDESILLDDFFTTTEADMPLTPADIAAVAAASAKAVWTADGIIPGPDHNPANPFWTGGRVLADIDVQVRAMPAAVAAAVAAANLKGLDPAAIASAVAAALGPDVAAETAAATVAAIAARLGTPAPTA